MTKSREIKRALKQSFPSIKFSVTYKHPYGYTIEWNDGIIEGATLEAVEAIGQEWDEECNISQDLDPIYVGDKVSYNHFITDKVWKSFVIAQVEKTCSREVTYSSKYNEFRGKYDKFSYHENDKYRKWLHNGIKCDLDNIDSISQKEIYYNRIKEKTELEVIESKSVVEALKKAKTLVSFHKADKDNQKLFVAANQGKFLVIGSNGSEYAIATCKLETTEEFYTVIPLAKFAGKEIGFCPFMKVLSKQKKINDFTYKLDTTDNDEIRLVAECDGSKFKFNTLPIDSFKISNELQVIIDKFMSDSNGYQSVESKDIDSVDTKDNNQIVESIQTENIDTQPKAKSNVIELVQSVESKDIDSVDTKDNNQIVESTNPEIENKIKYVHGVGDIELLPVDKLQVGMYLFFNEFFYTVSNIEKVDFINSRSSYIVSVNTLVSMVETQKILLTDDDQLVAWHVSYESVAKNKSDKPKEATAKRDITPEVRQSENGDITPEIDNYSDLLKPARVATHNRGIKGKGRDVLVRMLVKGATLPDIMSSCNWSKKTATNMITYCRGWGYNVILEDRESKLYRIV